MKSCNKKLKDTLIGEATLQLIKNKMPVNVQALLNELNNMQSHEIDSERLSALYVVIKEIQEFTASKEADSAGHKGVKHRKDGRKDLSINETNKNIH
ncbi:hypothetical protein ACMZZG_04275 [Pseudocitrobacter faecalis]|uniref:hypothetical protein n=1 Tax=Pseudocitrobacter faecalis TaxID=1398493 RepID=UPI0039F02F6E